MLKEINEITVHKKVWFLKLENIKGYSGEKNEEDPFLELVFID